SAFNKRRPHFLKWFCGFADTASARCCVTTLQTLPARRCHAVFTMQGSDSGTQLDDAWMRRIANRKAIVKQAGEASEVIWWRQTYLHSCNVSDIEMQCPLISVKLRVWILLKSVHD